MARSYYAEQNPRGFANEIEVHKFTSKAARDQWVDEHKDDGDVNSAYRGARAVTAREAKRTLARRGDAATATYIGIIYH